jgi:hypothetical protein
MQNTRPIFGCQTSLSEFNSFFSHLSIKAEKNNNNYRGLLLILPDIHLQKKLS